MDESSWWETIMHGLGWFFELSGLSGWVIEIAASVGVFLIGAVLWLVMSARERKARARH